MDKTEVILRFQNVSFNYKDKPILADASFSVRKNSKMTIIGQNGAGKSTIFKLITKELEPVSGQIYLTGNPQVGIAKQLIPRDQLHLTIKEYLTLGYQQNSEHTDVYSVDKEIKSAMNAVNISLDTSKKLSELSGGQKARILLAYAIIQDPDILLLDEPTNNLDYTGIDHLKKFLINYTKTLIVISHDSDFLNSFTNGVLNLDIHTKKVEQYVGDYNDVLERIAVQIEKERMQNVRLQRDISQKMEQVNRFSGSSAKLRRLANRLRDEAEEQKDAIVEVKQEDKTIRDFEIEAQYIPRPVIKIHSVSVLKEGKLKTKNLDLELRKGQKLLISGPNGIGKSTLLKSIIENKNEGVKIDSEAKVGYYSQDFSELDFEKTGFETLMEVLQEKNQKDVYAMAAKFLFSGQTINTKVGLMSEGQKGLLCYARFALLKPALLILDEPTNHINFRHIPVIAKALQEYKGSMILVSHDWKFLADLQIDEYLELSEI